MTRQQKAMAAALGKGEQTRAGIVDCAKLLKREVEALRGWIEQL